MNGTSMKWIKDVFSIGISHNISKKIDSFNISNVCSVNILIQIFSKLMEKEQGISSKSKAQVESVLNRDVVSLDLSRLSNKKRTIDKRRHDMLISFDFTPASGFVILQLRNF